jgi:hypothetical protein
MAAIWAGLLAIAVPTFAQPGGWSKADVDDPEVVAAAKFAVTKAQAKHKKLTMDRIIEAKHQVVAGMNYWVHLQLTDRSSGNPISRGAEAVIYQNLDGEYSLTSWKLQN